MLSSMGVAAMEEINRRWFRARLARCSVMNSTSFGIHINRSNSWIFGESLDPIPYPRERLKDSLAVYVARAAED